MAVPPMTPARWARVQALFDEALARPATARAAFLREACGADVALRAEVESLVAADTGPTPAVLDTPPDLLAAAVTARPAPTAAGRAPASHGPVASRPERQGAAGRVIGPYRLVRPLGSGGMGTVYLAERDDVGLRVALKLLREGRGTPSAVRRLLAERRLLARLEHPNVARLLDAGVTDEGVPWFAMEYVDGSPIIAACDAGAMPVRDRIGLFAVVCDAVAYAHAHHIVHRDLKPANVLVRADGAVKLLDFGIAKLLAPDSAPGAAPARAAWGPTSGVWLMTPRYAAPEQRRGEPATPAADVYALGLMLDELLSGRRPARHTPGVAALAQAMGAPADADDTGPAPDAVATARATTPERLRRALAGDVEAIIRRATAPEPAGRYADAAALADDLRRHLAWRPVRARPATWRYRSARFCRRLLARVGVGRAR